MEYYKNIEWDPPNLTSVLNTVKEFCPNSVMAEVRPFPFPVQKIIFRLLNIDISQCLQYNIMLVYFPPHAQINIHTDKATETDDPGVLDQCVFLPLENCEQLEWMWYDIIDPSKIFQKGSQGNWKAVAMAPASSASLISKRLCDAPFVSNIGTFHNLKNYGDKVALGLSIRLMPWSYESFQTCEYLPPIKNFKILK